MKDETETRARRTAAFTVIQNGGVVLPRSHSLWGAPGRFPRLGGRGRALALDLLPLFDGAAQRLHVGPQVRPAYVAERAQVGDLGLERLPLGGGQRLVR